MPKYWGKLIFSLGRFPEVGQKQKTHCNASSGGARKAALAKISFPKYFGITRRKNIVFCNFYFFMKKKPGPPLVPGVFILRLLLLTHFGETPVCEKIFFILRPAFGNGRLGHP